MARTNIEIDDGLVEKAMRLTGARTKREVVDIALRRLVEKGSLCLLYTSDAADECCGV